MAYEAPKQGPDFQLYPQPKQPNLQYGHPEAADRLQGVLRQGIFYFNFGPYFQDRFPALALARTPCPLTVNPKVAFLMTFRGSRTLD